MPSRYGSTFWHERAREARALSEQMKDEGVREGMIRVARKYERIALQSTYDEARIAFNCARETLRVSEGAAREQVVSITETVDLAWREMEKARTAIEGFRRVHLVIVDGVEVLGGEDALSSAR